MPPPNAVDPWFAGRHFGIVIDAGSSGSRLQIYSWKDPRSITIQKGNPLAYTLPQVEKGTQNNDLWVSKVEPGLSSLADNPKDVGAYLRPLLSHARNHVPPSLQHETPLFLLATAGMRLLTPEKQAEILQETCRFLITHSYFKIEGPSGVGPCGSSVRIITGEEEGLFGWIAVNYLMDGFTGSSSNQTTYGFLDMGGASTQIAFEPSAEHQGDAKNLIDVRLRLMGGEEIHHKVFVTTWLGYGTNQARERYVGKAITEWDGDHGGMDIIPDPCLPKDLVLLEEPVHNTTPEAEHLSKTHKMLGTGSFEQCMKKTSTLLNKNKTCTDMPCLMNGVHVPPINFSVSHFIGVSEYWYSSEHIFGLGGAYDYVQYERAASQFCSREWDGILKQHEESRSMHRLGGDGEVEKDGSVVEAGVWGPKVELPRLQMQCFKAAWIANVLHDGLGMPRITDLHDNNDTPSEADKVIKEADKKGLGKPVFQSLDTVGDIAISWTLGKMVLEASKEVPPLKKSAKPLVDPIDDIEDIENSPIHPIRPPFFDRIEDKITPHLPSSLTRSSLGFSPVLALFYLMVIFVVVMMACPMRRQLRAFFLRTMRKLSDKRNPYGEEMMEEGAVGGFGNGSRPSSPTSSGKRWFYPLQRVLPLRRSGSSPKLSVNTSNPGLRHASSTPPRASPTRSFGSNGNGPGALSTQYLHVSLTRSSSPASGYGDDSDQKSTVASNMSSRSRNASQMNISNMASRRVNGNAVYESGKPLHQDE